MRRPIPLVLGAALALVAASAQAFVLSTPTATPPAANVPAGQSGAVTVRWRIQTTGGAGSVVRSARGVFRIGGPNGPVVGTNDRTIQGTTRPTPQQTRSAVITESIQVPARVVLRAQERDATQISYTRVFDDGDPQQPGGVPGTLTLNLAGGQGAAFGVSRLALRFPDGARERVVAPDSETFVLADIIHTGTGRLEARWEIAEPSSTRGTPVFRTLSLVRRQLVGGGTRTTLRSPELPTRGEGAYLVRLRVTDPATGFDQPVLRYFVNPALEPAPAPEPIAATGPAAGASYRDGMRFSWQPINAAAVYRLEFHDRPPGGGDIDPTGDPASASADATDTQAAAPAETASPPISGILVSAPVDGTELSRLARSHLPGGNTYWWRVVAFDGRGRLVGRSPSRALTMPEE